MDVKFEAAGSLRCGRVNWVKSGLNKEITFPGCMISTNAGTVPHVTSETYSYVPKELRPSLTNVPIPSIIDHVEAISIFPGSMSELFNLSSASTTLVTTKDYLPRLRGKCNPTLNTTKAISVWGNSGRIMVNTERHVEMMSKLQPDLFEIVADGDTAIENVSKKRISKSFSNSIKFLEESLKLISSTTRLRDSYIIPALEGGKSVELRKQYTGAALKLLNENYVDKVIGFSIDGIRWEDSDSIELTKASVMDLPRDKLRFIFGPQSPQRILELVESGIDIFDTSYPIILAQKSFALTFHIPDKDVASSNEFKATTGMLDVSDESNRLMFEPLLKDCRCYTCQHHTRAYIYHLISVNELLAPILLTLHNLHHYLKFFGDLREAVADQRYEKFKLGVLSKIL